MAILTRNEIKKAIDRGLVKIEPLDGAQIGAGSVDLIALYPGTRICQFIFEECIGRAKYAGKVEVQDKP